MIFSSNRPKGYHGRGDVYIKEEVNKINKLILNIQKTFGNSPVKLPKNKCKVLAHAVAEFAEDIHNDTGIWRSFEENNKTFLKHALPNLQNSEIKIRNNEFSPYRTHHFLWILLSELNDDVIIVPNHKDLCQISESITRYLNDNFTGIPQDSGVKKFLREPMEYGWDVKRKLVWLGQNSYLFRHSYRKYVKEQGGKFDIATTDDFLCQAATVWSGLGVADILANMLDISKHRKRELLNWRERHSSYYRILKCRGQILDAKNLINDKAYKIRIGEFEVSPFKEQQIIFGNLAPWNNEWYWSGDQFKCGNYTEEQINEIKKGFLQKCPQIAYRFCSGHLKKAETFLKENYKQFKSYHGGEELVIYPDGLSMAADEQKQIRTRNEALAKKLKRKIPKRTDSDMPAPEMKYPKQILNCKNGVAVFFNRYEGIEIYMEFNDLLKGFKKKGMDMTLSEMENVRKFVYSRAASVDFLNRLIKDYGAESIIRSFLLPQDCAKSYLDCIIRSNKGHFFKNRYPNISLSEP